MAEHAHTQAVLKILADESSLAFCAIRGMLNGPATENALDAEKYVRAITEDLLADEGRTARALADAVGLDFDAATPYEIASRINWPEIGEYFFNTASGIASTTTWDASSLLPSARSGSLSLDDYHKLRELGCTGPTELLDGVVTLPSGEPLVFGPMAQRRAAALGIRVWGALDAVMADPRLRAEARMAFADALPGEH